MKFLFLQFRKKKVYFCTKNASLAGSVLDERANVQTELCETREREYRILYDSVLEVQLQVILSQVRSEMSRKEKHVFKN